MNDHKLVSVQTAQTPNPTTLLVNLIVNMYQYINKTDIRTASECHVKCNDKYTVNVLHGNI